MNAEAHAAFVEVLLRPSKIEQLLNQGITPEQRTAIDAENLAVAARLTVARAELSRQLTPEFLDVLAQAARLIGERDEGDTVVSVSALFEMAKEPVPDIERTDFGTPGYVDPRFANKVDFTIQRPSGLPIVRCDDLCGGAAP